MEVPIGPGRAFLPGFARKAVRKDGEGALHVFRGTGARDITFIVRVVLDFGELLLGGALSASEASLPRFGIILAGCKGCFWHREGEGAATKKGPLLKSKGLQTWQL